MYSKSVGWNKDSAKSVQRGEIPHSYFVQFSKNSCSVNVFSLYEIKDTSIKKETRWIILGKLNKYKFFGKSMNYNIESDLKRDCSDLSYHEKVYFEDTSSFEFTTKANVIEGNGNFAKKSNRNGNFFDAKNLHGSDSLRYECVLITPIERDEWMKIISQQLKD
jgi:hypothetical protein